MERFDTKFDTAYRAGHMRRLVIALMVGLVAAGSAFADQEGAKEGAADADAAKSLAEDDTLKAASKLSPAEKRSGSERMLGEMRDALLRATEILAEARAAKDVVQMNCINAKLSEIKALLRVAETSSVRLLEGIAESADDVSNHEFTRIAVAHRRVVMLRSQAEQCVGQEAIFTGDTLVDVEVDPYLEHGDPTATPEPPLAPEAPEVASKA